MGTTAPQRVGFLGMGLMGSRMARNLLRKGFSVTVWNRTRARAEELVKDGAKVASTPAEVMAEVDVACTCLATPAVLEEAVAGPEGLFKRARAGQLLIDFSTISPALARSLESRAKFLGVDFVESPVTGSKNGAEKGTLLLMVGGTEQAVARCQPVFAAVGEKSIYCGPVGSAAQVKLAGNALIASMLQGLSEGMLLATKAGVDPAKLLEVVQASGYRSPYFEFKGAALLRRDFSTHFSIDLMHKDLTLFLEEAAVQRVPTPLAAAVREVYALARAAGKGEQDIGAVITPFETLVGTEIRSKS
jgi:3-hydroxyisobutyrate dehydrogenase-like beta-hydroxyacid dehydrogenase